MRHDRVPCESTPIQYAGYHQGMSKVVWQARLSSTAAKYGEGAPTAAVCCNVCRTCVQTNLMTLGIAAVLGAGVAVRRFVGRVI
jgi:hypothetical protein